MKKLKEMGKDWDVPASVNERGEVLEFHPTKGHARQSGAASIKMAEPFVFEAALDFIRWGRRGSNASFVEFESQEGVTFTATLFGVASILRQLSNGLIEVTDDGRLYGTYMFYKRGSGISICAMSKPEARQYKIA